MSFTTYSIGATLAAAAMMFGSGCARTPDYSAARTPGQQIEARAEAMRQQGRLVQQGESLIADGQAMVARGQALVDQGNTMEGQRLIINGEAKIREGNLYLSRANEMELPPRPDTPTAARPYVQTDEQRGDRGTTGREATVETDVRDVNPNRP